VEHCDFHIESESLHSSLCWDGFRDSVSTIAVEEWRTRDGLMECFPGGSHDVCEGGPIEARPGETRQPDLPFREGWGNSDSHSPDTLEF
jgi:hypothetical protein